MSNANNLQMMSDYAALLASTSTINRPDTQQVLSELYKVAFNITGGFSPFSTGASNTTHASKFVSDAQSEQFGRYGVFNI